MNFICYQRAALRVKSKAVTKTTASVQVNMSAEVLQAIVKMNAAAHDRYVPISANVAHWSDSASGQRIEPLEHWLEVWGNEDVIAIARTGEDEYLYSYPLSLDRMRTEFGAKLLVAA